MQTGKRKRQSKASIFGKYKGNRRAVLYHGNCLDLLRTMPNDSVDLVLTSPPYSMGKDYEKRMSFEKFRELHARVLPEVVRVTKEGGSICWQVGYHVSKGVVVPLDYIVYDLLSSFPNVKLRNRIIWAFGHGLHCQTRFSGRHEVVLWFSKGNDHFFELDAVRVKQKYPGKRHFKGEKKGQFSGNPKGKNPEDVWHIPNVKAKHIEKTSHPCQFPVALCQRLIRALTPEKCGTVLDPFAGSGTACAAAAIEGRRFVGAELDETYYREAKQRVAAALSGSLQYRDVDKPILVPNQNMAVARMPEEFINA